MEEEEEDGNEPVYFEEALDHEKVISKKNSLLSPRCPRMRKNCTIFIVFSSIFKVNRTPASARFVHLLLSGGFLIPLFVRRFFSPFLLSGCFSFCLPFLLSGWWARRQNWFFEWAELELQRTLGPERGQQQQQWLQQQRLQFSQQRI